MIKIAPSILASDYLNLAAEIRRAEDSGADWGQGGQTGAQSHDLEKQAVDSLVP